MTHERTVAGLELAPPLERELRQEFGGWAEHVRARLAREGLAFLLAEYAELVESVETQSCAHGANGTRRIGAAWQQCCGVSYEYANDLAVRDALEIVLRVAGPGSAALPYLEIDALDARLAALHEPVPTRRGLWWRTGTPRGILP